LIWGGGVLNFHYLSTHNISITKNSGGMPDLYILYIGCLIDWLIGA
jgi:hypothetical protein